MYDVFQLLPFLLLLLHYLPRGRTISCGSRKNADILHSGHSNWVIVWVEVLSDLFIAR